MTDHDASTCPYPWCRAHAMCDCAYSHQFPHPAARCRYNRDNDDQEDTP